MWKCAHDIIVLHGIIPLWRGVVCGGAAGEPDTPERRPQSRLAVLKSVL